MQEPTFTSLAPVAMTTGALMRRSLPDVINYESQMLPCIRKRQAYKDGFHEMLMEFPAQFYGVANFNLHPLETDWCRARINFFDMKISRHLLRKSWVDKPESERTQFVAIPEHATFLHYNFLFNVPVSFHQQFFLEAPRIWKYVVPSGDLNLQVIGDTPGDDRAVRAYCLKAFDPNWTPDNMITSMELHRKKQTHQQ